MPLEWTAEGTVAAGVFPDSLADLELWLKGNGILGLNDGDPITTWPDNSGNARDATAVQSVTRKPIWKATAGPNSQPCVEMISASGDGGYFTLPNFLTGFIAGEGFVVVQIDNGSPVTGFAAPPFGQWGTASDSYYTSGGLIFDDFGSTARNDNITHAGFVLTDWQAIDQRSATNAWVYAIGGTTERTTNPSTVAWGTTPKIARDTFNDKLMKGRIAEVIFYSRILDDTTERKAVINIYLNTKYGFSLPT